MDHNATAGLLAEGRRRPSVYLHLLALIFLTFAAFYPTLRNGFVWDDDRYIEQNQQLRTIGGLERIWTEPLKAEPQYYPLTHTSFWIEYQLWGLSPLGYHLDNILLHAASAVLLWRLLRRLAVPGAWVVAAIFAVHPLQVESVAWATERKNVLSGFFYFLSLWAYLHTTWGRRIWQTEETTRTRAGWYTLALVLFVAALLSKSVTSTLPAVILVLCWWKRGKIAARDVWPLTPMLAAGAAMGLLTAWMEKHVVGAIGPEFDFRSLLDRLCIAGRAFWFYLGKLVWPWPLSFVYPHWQVDPRQHPAWILFPLAAVGLLIVCWVLRRRIGRGPAAAMLLFAGTLLPALGFANVYPMRYSYVADHFQSLACIGPIALIVSVLATRPASTAKRALAGVMIMSLCVASNVRARVFFDRRTLWADTLAKNPDSRMVHNNYAAVLAGAGEIEAAKAQYRIAMRLGNDPADVVGVGQCFAKQGDFSTALALFQQAEAATPVSNEPILRHILASRKFQIATAYEGLAEQFPANAPDDLAKAEQAYRQAIDLFPEYEDARKNLAVLFINQGRSAEAIQQCQSILAQDPDSVSAHVDLGTAYYTQDRLDLAVAQYKRVLELEPQNVGAMASEGAILAQMGDYDQGVALLEKALSIDPADVMARTNLQAIMNDRAKSGP